MTRLGPPRTLRAVLTRQHDGAYMLTLRPPAWSQVRGAGHGDAYVTPGDPLGVRHLCAEMTQLASGLALAPGEAVEIELTLEPRLRDGLPVGVALRAFG